MFNQLNGILLIIVSSCSKYLLYYVIANNDTLGFQFSSFLAFTKFGTKADRWSSQGGSLAAVTSAFMSLLWTTGK